MRLDDDQRCFARDLRLHSTDAERRLWRYLRNRQVRGLRFRRQHPIGPYFADFVCLEHHLIIELDGGQHDQAVKRDHDQARSEWLARQGFHVLRFWNNDVLQNTAGVLQEIDKACGERCGGPHPAYGPLPQSRER